MYKQILVLCFLTTAVTAMIGWRDCGSQLGTIESIRMTNCPQTPCRFVRGNTYEALVDGTWRTNSDRLPAVFSVVIFGLPLPILEADACAYKTRGSCPALNGSPFTVRTDYPVPENLPAVNTVARGIVNNDFGDIVMCIEFDITIV